MKWLSVLCLALVVGCTSEPPAPSADPSPTSSASSSSPSASVSPEPQSGVLARIDVTRRGDELGFAALWVWGNGRSHRELVIGTGDEGNVLIGAINPDYVRVVAISDIRPYNIHRAFHGDWGGGDPSFTHSIRTGLIDKYGWKTETEARRNVKVYDKDYHELINDPDVEAVIIALPLHLHAKVSIECMRAGKHVLTEKLMAHNVAQCKVMARVAEQTGLCLSTGHLALDEIRVLVPAARRAGVRHVLVTHPDLALSAIGPEDQRALADAGAVLEKDVNTLGPPWHSTTIEAMVQSIREVGPARCVLATDYGQLHSPAPVDGLRIFVQLCLEQGISEDEVRTMVVDNPARLLGLD